MRARTARSPLTRNCFLSKELDRGGKRVSARRQLDADGRVVEALFLESADGIPSTGYRSERAIAMSRSLHNFGGAKNATIGRNLTMRERPGHGWNAGGRGNAAGGLRHTRAPQSSSPWANGHVTGRRINGKALGGLTPGDNRDVRAVGGILTPI